MNRIRVLALQLTAMLGFLVGAHADPVLGETFVVYRQPFVDMAPLPEHAKGLGEVLFEDGIVQADRQLFLLMRSGRIVTLNFLSARRAEKFRRSTLQSGNVLDVSHCKHLEEKLSSERALEEPWCSRNIYALSFECGILTPKPKVSRSSWSEVVEHYSSIRRYDERPTETRYECRGRSSRLY